MDLLVFGVYNYDWYTFRLDLPKQVGPTARVTSIFKIATLLGIEDVGH